MEKKIQINIEGMHCTSCAMNIDGELEDMGVKESSTNYAKSNATVTFDESKISEESIVEAIKKLGYLANISE